MATRRSVLSAIAGAAIGLPSIWPVRAQQKYPDRPIKLIVPFPPGGPIDTMARMTAQELTSRVGQVVVENRPGGGSTIGTKDVAAADPRRLHADVRLLGLARRGAGALFEPRPRSAQGVHSDRDGGAVAARFRRQQRRAGKDRSANSSPMPRPIPARSIMAPGSARRRICSRPCSRPKPRSTWSTCPIPARRNR